MKKIILIIIVIAALLIISILPLWPKALKNEGYIKINTWQKFFMYID